MRIFVGGVIHETNSFSPIATDLASFRDFFFYDPSTRSQAEQCAVATGQEWICEVYSDVIRAAAADGLTVIPGLITAAEPSAPITLADYERLKAQLVAQVRAAMPLDLVVLALHGAQMAGAGDAIEQDCEGDLLASVRAIVGPRCRIGAVLDLHANVSDRMIAESDMLIACKEYPHTDFSEVALSLYRQLYRAARGQVIPVTAFVRIPMLAWFHSTTPAVSDLIAAVRDAERGKILAISLIHGFPISDCVDTCGSVIVVADGEPELARSVAERFADALYALRDRGIAPGIPAGQIGRAIDAAPPGLVVVADCADNSGGGAASDSTYLLKQLANTAADKVAVAMIWDPSAVATVVAAGVGARLTLSVGGRASDHSGAPFCGEAQVLSIRHDARQRTPEGTRIGLRLGRSAHVRMKGIDIIINDRRQQVFSPDVFTEHGIDPRDYRALIVKSAQHFRAYFDELDPVATLYCDGPGLVPRRLEDIGFERVQRPIWPLDELPEWSATVGPVRHVADEMGQVA